MAESVGVAKRLEAVERELRELKKLVQRKPATRPKKIVSLKGLMKGIEVTDEDIEEAKRSLSCYAK